MKHLLGDVLICVFSLVHGTTLQFRRLPSHVGGLPPCPGSPVAGHNDVAVARALPKAGMRRRTGRPGSPSLRLVTSASPARRSLCASALTC